MPIGTFPIREIFGYPPENASPEARKARDSHHCPFLDKRCVKESRRLDYPFGACSVRQIKDEREIVICPMRFYGDNQSIIEEVGRRLCKEAACLVRIPEVRVGRFSIDWVVACCDASGTLVDYHGVEVVAADTTGSLDRYFEAYMKEEDWQNVRQRYGINWANVYKRTLPQLIAKGALLASYGKKLGIILQDRLLERLRTRLTIPVESESSANMFFFLYRLKYLTETQRYSLTLSEVIPTLAERLTAEYVAGLTRGIGMPSREEFEQTILSRIQRTG